MNWRDSDDPIVRAVGERGYLDKPAAQVAALQLVKIVEEIDEFRKHITTGRRMNPPLDTMLTHLAKAAEKARIVFDDGNAGGLHDYAAEGALPEVADMTVVLHVLWAALSEVVGRSLDADAEALAKARGDVARGVRA